jgi:uncharacterized protein (TIGR00369 family)
MEPNLDTGLLALLGFQVVSVDADSCVLRWTAGPEHHQPHGIVHGGVHCAAVETAASVAAGAWFAGRGVVVGTSNHTEFLRPVREGTLTATATPVQRGRSQQLWDVAVTDEQDRLVATGRVRLANQPT